MRILFTTLTMNYQAFRPKRILYLIIAVVLCAALMSPCASYAAKRKPHTVAASHKKRDAKRIPIITYHRVVSDKEKSKHLKDDMFSISSSVFKKQMRWLHKHHYRTISAQEFYDWYKGKIKLPKKTVMITFDDGNYSVIKYALPSLKKYKMKATFFIIGEYIQDLTNTESNNGRYHHIGQDVIDQEIKAYPKLKFQSHSYGLHHQIEGKPTALSAAYDMQEADFTAMYDRYGYTFLAYPYGAYTNETIEAAKAGHMQMAFTFGKSGYATRKQNCYAIRRIDTSANQSMKKFCKWFKKR